MENLFGINELQGDLSLQQFENVVTYMIAEFENPITKKQLWNMKEQLGGGFTLITNAGVEIHTSELKNGIWDNIRIVRYKD